MLADRPSLVRHTGRLLAVALAFLACATVAAATARAQDLIILNGDPTQMMSGNVTYDVVYIDGDVDLLGDTTISASSIYIGPDASLDTCYVPAAGGGGDTCTAGRSLTLQASGPVIVSKRIDLSGGTGTAVPGGNLTISGNPVAVGDIETGPYTSGTGISTSGQVSITSGGTLATGAIHAPGAGVTLKAAGAIDVAGDVETEGAGNIVPTAAGRAAAAGPVSIASSGGDVRLDGTVNATGNYGSGGTVGGGNGAAVTISGANVATEEIDANGGGSQNGFPGVSAPVSVSAGASLDVLGSIDVSGQSGGGSTGAVGSQVSLSAGGTLAVGGIDASGGYGASSDPGGAGGSITATAPSGASLGSLSTAGGQGGGGAQGGNGGPISVTSSGGSIDTGVVDTSGGPSAVGPGANGAPITLAAHTNLTVGGRLDSSGSGAGGSSPSPWGGGSGGSQTLYATTGTLALDGYASSAGGFGASNANSNARGGGGGSGGQVVIVAGSVGALASISSNGGDGGGYGNAQGPGGSAGAILAFTTAPIFNAHQAVTSDGGNGNPTGAAGAQHQDVAPSAVTVDPQSGALSFTSNSPDALGYQVLMAVGTGAPTAVLSTAATSGLHPTAPICQQVTFTVEAVNSSVGWTSAPSPGADYTRQPSATQTCAQAPAFTIPAIKHLSRRRLRRNKWVVSVQLKLKGIGAVQATLVRLGTRSGRRRRGKSVTVLTTPSQQVTKPGVVRLHISLPSAGRSLATYKLDVTTTSPSGAGHSSHTISWEIVK